MQPKLISAIIPAYNAERYISQAIESVLAQTYRPIEIVVADDGSTDGTAAIARSYSAVRYVYQPNQGPPVARNTGLAHSSGETERVPGGASGVWMRRRQVAELSPKRNR
jgi:glycosyltransferase involved in cell wall biosynthesis